jgi:peptidase S41-like protein
MRQLSRRTLLAGASAAAATALAPISAPRRAAADAPCLRSLKDFLADAKLQQLSSAQRDLIVDQAIKLLENFYVHLPLKGKLYGAAPLERLRKIARFNSDPPFHAEMTDIFNSLRDMHTHYRPPTPYTTGYAFLPFKVEACVEGGQRKYIASRVVDGFVNSPPFGRGVEILSWNGVPVEQAAERAGGEGGTPNARHALGLARLTCRVLQLQPAPEEGPVEVHYRAGGQEFIAQFSWQVLTQPDGACGGGACNEIQQIQDFRKFLYAPYYLCSSFGDSDQLETPDGVFGYIRIFSFDPALESADLFVTDFKTKVASFANNVKGLIVDVRDNGGGSIQASERIVQFVAPATGHIEAARFYFRATPEILKFCQLPTVTGLGSGPDGLTPWVHSIEGALKTGATFSDAFQYTPDARCNEPGRVPFPHPVIVVTSALTYSSAEFFAAGFQDHGGMILGVDETTGGGGANFRQYSDLNTFFTDALQPPPFEDLDKEANGAGFQVAFRRAKRVGFGTGREIEDRGIHRDLSYAMTRDDLLFGNRDLKRAAARLLAQM